MRPPRHNAGRAATAFALALILLHTRAVAAPFAGYLTKVGPSPMRIEEGPRPGVRPICLPPIHPLGLTAPESGPPAGGESGHPSAVKASPTPGETTRADASAPAAEVHTADNPVATSGEWVGPHVTPPPINLPVQSPGLRNPGARDGEIYPTDLIRFFSKGKGASGALTIPVQAVEATPATQPPGSRARYTSE